MTMNRVAVAALALAALLAVPAALTADGGKTFRDVPDDHPLADAIAEAVAAGWFRGYEDGTFKPDRVVPPHQVAEVVRRTFPEGTTRAELAAFVVAGNRAINPEETANETTTTTTTTAADKPDVPAGYGNHLAAEPDRPIIRVNNQVLYLAWCHYPQDREDYIAYIREAEGNEDYDLPDVLEECEQASRQWSATVLYDPAGIESSVLSVDYDLLIEGRWTNFHSRVLYDRNDSGTFLTSDDPLDLYYRADDIRINEVRNAEDRPVPAIVACGKYPAFGDEGLPLPEDCLADHNLPADREASG